MKAYKYKLKTNAKFVAGCSATLNLCRELYNAALQERRDAYQINGLSINYHAQAVENDSTPFPVSGPKSESH